MTRIGVGWSRVSVGKVPMKKERTEALVEEINVILTTNLN